MTEPAVAKLRELLSRMGIEAEVSGREEVDHILLDVSGPETGLVIGKKGATLDAIQYLVNKMFGHGEPGDRKPIYVDAEGYRQRRAESLQELAQQLAAKARKTLRPVAVDPMSPADRRVMHMALAGTPGLTTRSEGEGAQRRLMIIPDPQFDFGPQADDNP
ncbi:MAG: KH domain-containing protein [Myxococcales bacterium]|nr:KH domain-containing protein [Myxococcales bacterium]